MAQAIKDRPQIDNIETDTAQENSIWTSALVVAFGWMLSNIIVFLITDWFLSGTAGVEFEPILGAMLLLAILGLLAGFTLSLALWFSQENFIGIHALAYTVLVSIFTATFAYMPDGVFILPVLFIGLYIGMKWAKPDISFSNIVASFVVWLAVAVIMFLFVLMLPYSTTNSIEQLVWQCVWSGGVGLFGSAFMFWQLSRAELEIAPPEPEVRTRAADWEKIYSSL